MSDNVTVNFYATFLFFISTVFCLKPGAMKCTNLFSVLSLVGFALATPTPTVEKRATTFCGQWDSLQTGGYTVYNNLWGKDSATSGSQCTTVDGMSGSNLVWSVSWTWQGGPYNVKSYPNAVKTITPKRLSAVGSIPTTWSWRYLLDYPPKFVRDH
jgi:xyloglucan-specific endo-beta-1,4-glucanase